MIGVGGCVASQEGKAIQGRLEVNYGKMDLNPTFGTKDFSLAQLAVKRNNTYALNPALKGYKFIDQTK